MMLPMSEVGASGKPGAIQSHKLWGYASQNGRRAQEGPDATVAKASLLSAWPAASLCFC